MIFHARTFSKDGNKFLIPGFWYSDDDPEAGMGSQSVVLCESMMFAIVLGATADGWVAIVADEGGNGAIANLPYRFIGPQFAHGAVDIMLIGGPIFDVEINE